MLLCQHTPFAHNLSISSSSYVIIRPHYQNDSTIYISTTHNIYWCVRVRAREGGKALA